MHICFQRYSTEKITADPSNCMLLCFSEGPHQSSIAVFHTHFDVSIHWHLLKATVGSVLIFTLRCFVLVWLLLQQQAPTDMLVQEVLSADDVGVVDVEVGK